MHWRKQKSKLFFEGNVFKSDSSGDFIVTEFVSKQEVHIKFLDTGYETIVGSSEITRGQTKDCSKPSVFGVGYLPKIGKFRARLGKEHLGTYDTQEEAFYTYKQAKESYIKLLANKWRDQIDPMAYNALMSYQVEITD